MNLFHFRSSVKLGLNTNSFTQNITPSIFFNSVDPFKIVFRMAKSHPDVFLLSHSHADTPFIDPTPASPSYSCPSALTYSSSPPFFLSLFLAPCLSPSCRHHLSLRCLVIPGKPQNCFRSLLRATLHLRRRPPPPVSINPTNQEARICPFELSGWLAALCCTRNFV